MFRHDIAPAISSGSPDEQKLVPTVPSRRLQFHQQIVAALGITWEEVASKLSVARRSLRQELGHCRRTEE
jgi:hypothetical protein